MILERTVLNGRAAASFATAASLARLLFAATRGRKTENEDAR